MDKTQVMEDVSLLIQKHLFITTTDKHGVPPTKRLFKVAMLDPSPNLLVHGERLEIWDYQLWYVPSKVAVEKESPKTEVIPMNTSIVFSIMSWRLPSYIVETCRGALPWPKRHGRLGKSLLWASECGLLLILRVNRNLKITREAIEETIVLVYGRVFRYLIQKGNGNGLCGSSFNFL
ncbi:hypothetical protein Tco_0120952 [Tanacetum coccineum]